MQIQQGDFPNEIFHPIGSECAGGGCDTLGVSGEERGGS